MSGDNRQKIVVKDAAAQQVFVQNFENGTFKFDTKWGLHLWGVGKSCFLSRTEPKCHGSQEQGCWYEVEHHTGEDEHAPLKGKRLYEVGKQERDGHLTDASATKRQATCQSTSLLKIDGDKKDGWPNGKTEGECWK